MFVCFLVTSCLLPKKKKTHKIVRKKKTEWNGKINKREKKTRKDYDSWRGGKVGEEEDLTERVGEEREKEKDRTFNFTLHFICICMV